MLHSLGDHSGHERLDNVLDHTGRKVLLNKGMQKVTVDRKENLGATRMVVRSIHTTWLKTQDYLTNPVVNKGGELSNLGSNSLATQIVNLIQADEVIVVENKVLVIKLDTDHDSSHERAGLKLVIRQG